MKKKIFIGILLAVVLGVAWYYYQNKVATTKIAVIAYPDFMLEKMITSNTNKWVEIETLSLDEIDKIDDYSFVLLRGHGINITQEQLQKVRDAGKKGVKIYIGSITNPEYDLTNLVGKELDYVTDLMQNKCTKNYRSLFNYVRKEIDQKKYFNGAYEDAYILPDNFFFHLSDNAIFATITEYEKYYKEQGLFKENAPKVAFLAGNINNLNSNSEHTVKLVKSLEAKGLNVYPIQAWGRARLKMLEAIKPDLVILRPHGRLAMGAGDKAVKWLQKHNIPLYAPLTVFQDYEKWSKNPQGMAGGMLSMSVVLPELDGAVMPYALIAKFKNKKGYKIFDVIPGRVEDFSEAVAKRIALKKKPNSEKKIAIYYFKGVGKNALNAGGLEVMPSLYNTLQVLKKEGYNLDGLPETKEEFAKIIMAKGAVLAPYALGAFDKYLKNGNPELVEKATYEKWCKEAMPKELYEDVVKRYGEAPGSYMAVTKNGKEYIAVTAIRFGNICLLPQPMSAVGKDTDKIVHGAKMAPPHTYIASYLWTQKAFNADAICHFGTHGSLEFTSHKQVALSSYDWPDRLIGAMPHFYIYTISNIGEGIIAKRRSYTTLLTHLTPPFMKSELHSELERIHEKVDRYSIAPKNSPLRRQYAISIKKLVEEMNIHKAVKVDTTANYIYTEEDVEKIHGYLEEIEEEKVTSGIYTLGVPYPAHKLKETTELMVIDAIAFNWARLDAERKKISHKQAENVVVVSHTYKPKALRIIRKSMKGVGLDKLVESVLTAKELQFAHEWKRKHKEYDLFAIMMSRGKKKGEDEITAKKKQLPKLIVKLCEKEKNKEFILKLQSDKIFKKSSKILDAAYRAKATKMANKMKKMAPEMYESISILTQKDMLKLLTLMQDSVLYSSTFELLKDEKLAERIEQERIVALKEKAKVCEQKAYLKTLQWAFSKDFAKKVQKLPKKQLKTMLSQLDFYDANTNVFEYCSAQLAKNLKAKVADSLQWKTTMDKAKEQLEKNIEGIERKEADYARTILQIEESIRSVATNKKNLAQSTKLEQEAIVNAFGGGYTSPSSGGDPIINPRALPTGRNMYSIDAERTPYEEAWEVGKKLAKSLLKSEFENKGHYPQKISFTLWSTNFISTEGATIAQILYLLGVEPVRGGFGSVRGLKLIPMEVLQRPRIDVVVQTSGQLRDLAASRLSLINRAVALVAEAKENDSVNFVAKGKLDAEKYLLSKGFSPVDARKFAGQRVFGGANGNYGTGIMGMVEDGASWEDEKEIAETYINNMGAVYDTDKDWGTFRKGVFEAALQNTEVVVHPRSSNTWGALSLDHVYEFMGGLNLAVRYVTGNDPSAYFNDFRNVSNPRMQTLEQAIGVETNSTVFNPKFIKELLKGEGSSLGAFAETFRNTYGWNVMKPKAIDKYIWDNYFDIYIKDKYNLDIQNRFKDKNPYAMQEMTAVMLETARKGYWKATEQQLKELAKVHIDFVRKYEAACSGFVCDNAKLRDFIAEKATPEEAKAYKDAIRAEREVKIEEAKKNVVLKKEEQDKKTKKQQVKSATQNHTIWWIGGLLLLLIISLFVWKKRK